MSIELFATVTQVGQQLLVRDPITVNSRLGGAVTNIDIGNITIPVVEENFIDEGEF